MFSTSPAFFVWEPACWLHVSGDDAATFLQGQFTNDLRLLAESGAVYGLWLTLKGKVQADGFVLRGGGPNEFWIGSYFSPAATLVERLESHVIADDVVVRDATGEMIGVSLLGEIDVETLQQRHGAGAFIFAGRRDVGKSTEWVTAGTRDTLTWLAGLDAVELSAEEMERRRIAAGLPAIPRDLGPADLPHEAGLDTAAISYTKGCYLGQEVMARLKSMGQVRRRLWRVRGDGEFPGPLPAAVFRNGRQVGELRTAARDGERGWIGLAMVTLMHVEPGAELSWAADASPALRLEAAP